MKQVHKTYAIAKKLSAEITGIVYQIIQNYQSYNLITHCQ